MIEYLNFRDPVLATRCQIFASVVAQRTGKTMEFIATRCRVLTVVFQDTDMDGFQGQGGAQSQIFKLCNVKQVLCSLSGKSRHLDTARVTCARTTQIQSQGLPTNETPSSDIRKHALCGFWTAKCTMTHQIATKMKYMRDCCEPQHRSFGPDTACLLLQG